MVCQQRRASGRRMRLEPRGRATSSTDRSEKARENRPDTPPGSARDEPKSSKNGAGTPPGRSWSIRGAMGTFQRRSGATPERSWGAPGASQSGPGAFPVRPRTSRDSPGKVPSVPRTQFADARREHGAPNGCPSGFSRKSLGESQRNETLCACLRHRVFGRFSIGVRAIFRSTSTSRVERALNAEHRILCAWARFSKVFSKSHGFERTNKRWTKRSKIDRQVDRKNIGKSMKNRSKTRWTT